MNKYANAFTVIELLVAVFIVGLFSSLTLINWRTSQGNLALQRSVVAVSQDIKKTQELALQAQVTSCLSGTLAGYGIYASLVSPGSYKIFAYCTTVSHTNYQYNASTDAIVASINLESGVVISNLSQNPLSIVFIPPDPAVWINGIDQPGQTATITLAPQNNSSVTKSIAVSGKGVVNIQ